jgi:HPt (histidine-containing phosphotransfer) domain-containing protein
MPSVDFAQKSSALNIPLKTYMRILEMASAQIREDIPAARAAISTGDADKVQGLSHRWKGDLANLRLDDLSQTARSLNDAVKRSAPVTEQQRFLDEFKQKFSDLQNSLLTKTGDSS